MLNGYPPEYAINTQATKTAASAYRPTPDNVPHAAEHQIVAAVFSPLTLNPSFRMRPPPIKPIPETICAATLDGSPLPIVMSHESTVKAAAPTETRMLVRNPALRCLYCRSIPINVPITKAHPILAK